MSNPILEVILNNWAAAQGLVFNDDGYYFISDNDFKGNIKISANNRYIYINTYLKLQNWLSSGDFLRICLEMNLYQEKTKGAVIAYDPILDDMVLSYRLETQAVDELMLSTVTANQLTTTQALHEDISTNLRDAQQPPMPNGEVHVHNMNEHFIGRV